MRITTMPNSVSIVVSGVKLKVRLGDEETERLLTHFCHKDREVKGWISLDEVDGSTATILLEAVSAIQVKADVARLGNLEGVSVKDVCRVAPEMWKYPTLVRKVNKPGGIELEMASERRIKLSKANIESLGLMPEHVAALKKIESERTDED